jgi:adenine-specific DNA-methyltransferase
MEGHYIDPVTVDRPWQVDLCQFFTREEVARFCIRQLRLPRNLLSIRLLEPAAGQGAFILPLIQRLVRACEAQRLSYSALRPTIRAYEIDPIVAKLLQNKCAAEMQKSGLTALEARKLVQSWIRNEDFLEARITNGYSHIVGNPPYIRWDAVPAELRKLYRGRFSLFKERADLYVTFIEKSLGLLRPGGQLGFLCPGTWTRNVYGGDVREALTSNGHLKAIIDFSEIDSFETPADAYPHFFVFQQGRRGTTRIASVTLHGKSPRSASTVSRQFPPSTLPLVLSLTDAVASTVHRAREKFPRLENAGCTVRVGSATGCNAAFLLHSARRSVEESRLLPFVNARSIHNGTVLWAGTNIVNVFDAEGKPVKLSKYPRLRSYLQRNKGALKARAKASKSKIWWRSIDVLQSEWYDAPKLLVVDISAVPVIGLDEKGYCAGGGVYQIKSKQWPLRDLWVLLSAGVLGLFVVGMATGAKNGFYRFQKKQLAGIPLPSWRTLDKEWRTRFRAAHRNGDLQKVLEAVAELYDCRSDVLAPFVARDWHTFLARPET